MIRLNKTAIIPFGMLYRIYRLCRCYRVCCAVHRNTKALSHAIPTINSPINKRHATQLSYPGPALRIVQEEAPLPASP